MIRFLEGYPDADNSGLHLSTVVIGQLNECVCSCVQRSRQRKAFKEALCLIHYSSLGSVMLMVVLTLVRLCSELCTYSTVVSMTALVTTMLIVMDCSL